MSTVAVTAPLLPMEASKKSLSALAAEAHSSAPKVTLKSKWMSLFEQFIMVRRPIWPRLSKVCVELGTLLLTQIALFLHSPYRDKTQVTNLRTSGMICSCSRSMATSWSNNSA